MCQVARGGCTKTYIIVSVYSVNLPSPSRKGQEIAVYCFALHAPGSYIHYDYARTGVGWKRRKGGFGWFP